MKMKIAYLDACFPEDLQGIEGWLVAVPVDGNTTCLELCDSLKAEISALEVAIDSIMWQGKAAVAVDELFKEGMAFYPFKHLDKSLAPPVGYELREERPDGNDSSLYWYVGPNGTCGTPLNTRAEAINEAWEKAKPFVRRPQYYAYYRVELYCVADDYVANALQQTNVVSFTPYNGSNALMQKKL